MTALLVSSEQIPADASTVADFDRAAITRSPLTRVGWDLGINSLGRSRRALRCFSSIPCTLPFVVILLLLVSDGVQAQEHDPALQERFLEGVARVGQRLEDLSFRARCRDSSQFTGLSDSLRASYAEQKRDPEKLTVKEFDCAVRGPWTLKKQTSAASRSSNCWSAWR